MTDVSAEKTIGFWIEVPESSAWLNEETARWEIRIPEPTRVWKKRANQILYCPEEECAWWGRWTVQYRGHYALAHILGLPDDPKEKKE